MPTPVIHTLLDLGRAPYVLYGVKYIELVSLENCGRMSRRSCRMPTPVLQATSGFHTPKAVTYHEPTVM